MCMIIFKSKIFKFCIFKYSQTNNSKFLRIINRNYFYILIYNQPGIYHDSMDEYIHYSKKERLY